MTYGTLKRSHGYGQLVLFGIAIVVGGCDSSSKSKQLTLTAPADGQILTAPADDADPEKPGVQFDIEGMAPLVGKGTSIELVIDEDKQTAGATVDAKGEIHMPGVTLPPGAHTIYLQTATASASSSKTQKYTLRAIEISAPDNDATLTMMDDEDTSADGFQLTVKAKAYETDPTQQVTLLVDGKAGPTTLPSDSGDVMFKGVTLLYGKHTLQATVTEDDVKIESEEITITLEESCAKVTYLQPAPPKSGDSLTLGGAGKCPAKTTDPFTTTVEISTDAGDGRPVDLIVNGQPIANTTVKGSTAVFNDVALTNHTGSNTIVVRVQDSGNHVCPAPFPVDVFVDCAGPDCTLKSPTPFSFKDSSGTTFYLNRSMTSAGGNGFDFEVASSAKVVGQDVELVIDGNSKKSIKVKAEADGKAAHAVFPAVALSDGAHTIQAYCTDSTGNQTSTDEFDWSVDVTACDVTITDPANDADVIPEDDTDGSAQGTQTVVTSTVQGGDCTAKRASVCDPTKGIKDADAEFVAYDGSSPTMSTVTLDATMTDQNLCVEIQDHAGNVGRGSVAVKFHAPPRVQIESPADETKVNVAGGTGYTADAVSSTTACDAVFSVACTEVGSDVELHRTNVSTAAFATGACQARQSGDPALPSGFSGRAKVTATFDDGNTDVVVVATQSVTGSSTKTVVGASDPITLHGDCKAPTLVLSTSSPDSCATGSSGQVQLASAGMFDIAVTNSDGDSADYSLSLSNDGSTAAPTPPGPTTNTPSMGTFDNVDLGGAGNVTLSVHATDAFGNDGQVSCASPIVVVSDLPMITAFTSPADGASFGPGSGCAVAGHADEYGVHVVATVDKQSNRTADVSVNNGSPISVTVGSGGSIDACVPAGDGASAIKLTAHSTQGPGQDSATHNITTHLADFTAPMDGSTLTMSACGTLGVNVTLTVDLSLNNLPFTLSSGNNLTATGTVSNGMISQCLELSQGSNTITVSIGSAMVMSVPVNITVVTQAPPDPIVLDTPNALNPGASDYRAGHQTVTWTPPPPFTGGIQSYQLRCDYTAIASNATTQQKDAWWAAAKPVSPIGGGSIGTGASSVDLQLRPAEPNNCVLRAENVAHLFTPIDHSTDLTTLTFRQTVITTGTGGTRQGVAVAAAGDVNGDGKADVLVGGWGHAELIFGNAVPANAQKVVFTGNSNITDIALAGIGDFNHDGIDDFAISDPDFPCTVGGCNYDGRVMVFFGRTSGWPSSIDFGIAPPACPADLCIEDPLGSGDEIALAINTAGDFDGDGNHADLAIGSPFYPATPDPQNPGSYLYSGQLLVVLGSNYEVRSCSGSGDCQSTETCQASVCTLTSATFWGLRYETTGNWLNAPSGSGTPTVLKGFVLNDNRGVANQDLGALGLGTSIAALGNVDSSTGGELVIGAPESSLAEYLSGRPYSGTTGFTTLSRSDLGLRNPSNSTPAGYSPAFKSGTGPSSEFFGFNVCAIGNVYDVSGALQSGVADVAIGNSLTDAFFVYPGDRMNGSDPGFSAPRIRVLANNSSNPGTSIGTGSHASYGLLGDLDKDGNADLLSGTRTTKEILLFYHDQFARVFASGDAPTSRAVSFHMTSEASDTAELAVQYVGDFNGDTFPDVVVGDWRANGFDGQAVLFY